MNSLLSEISAAILPALVALFGTVLTIIINRAAEVAKTRWGMEVEARHREALHSAIMSGVLAAVDRGLSGKAAIDSALEHALDSVPDAVTAFERKQGPVIDVMRTIAEGKLAQALIKAVPK